MDDTNPDGEESTHGRVPRIGVLIDDLADPYTSRVVAALHRQAIARDVSLVFYVGGHVGEDHMANGAFSAATPDSLQALIVLAITREHSPAGLAGLFHRFRGFPVCTIGTPFPGIPCVQVDNEPGMRAALDHLLRHHGRRRVLFLRGPASNAEANQRFEIYRDVLRRQGMRFDESLVIQGDFHEDSAEQLVAEHLQVLGTNFDAVMAANDAMALGAIHALERAGVEIPDRVAVVGFDDIEAAWSASVPLTTVQQPFELLADEALTILLDRDPSETSAQPVTVRGALQLRRSCGCIADAIERAGLPSEPPSVGVDHAQLNAERRADVWLRRFGVTTGARELVSAFLVPLPGEAEERTYTVIEKLSRALARTGRSARHLQELLTEIRGQLRPALAEDEGARDRVERLFHQARLVVAHAAERQVAAAAQRAEARQATLMAAARALVTSFEPQTLKRAIRTQLPRLGISGVSLLVFDHDPESWPEVEPAAGAPADDLPQIARYSRCFVAYEKRRMGSYAPQPEKIPTGRLWPFARTQRSTETVQALYFDEEPIGLLILEWGDSFAATHQAFAEMLSAALHGARLAQRLADEAAARERAERERLQQELAIAARIQTSILPRDICVEGLEVVASMQPAEEVGGDYYDVLPFQGGAWIGIGDVAGHGLRPGLVMVMLQSVVAAVVALEPATKPRDMIHVVNQVLYDNVRRRLAQNEHATLSVIRYQRDGELSFAGAHEDFIIYRAATGRCELIPTDGTWVAATRDIDAVTQDQSARLGDGDVLVLYTDGAIEGRDAQGEPFGLDALVAAVEEVGARPTNEIHDHLVTTLARHVVVRDDDVAFVVARHRA